MCSFRFYDTGKTKVHIFSILYQFSITYMRDFGIYQQFIPFHLNGSHLSPVLYKCARQPFQLQTEILIFFFFKLAFAGTGYEFFKTHFAYQVKRKMILCNMAIILAVDVGRENRKKKNQCKISISLFTHEVIVKEIKI